MRRNNPAIRRPFRLRRLVIAVMVALAIQVPIAPAAASPPNDPTTVLTTGSSDAAIRTVASQRFAMQAAPRAPVIIAAVTRTPPSPGAVVVENSLADGGLVPTGSCPSGRVSGETVGEGLILKVRGPCVGNATVASAQAKIPGLRIPDGEIRFEMKFVSGVDRASLGVIARASETQERRLGYAFIISPSMTSLMGLTESGVKPLSLGIQPSPVSRADWNTVAIRLQGDGLWLIVNDVPTDYAANGGFTDGDVVLNLMRSGNVNDESETSVVLRNMRISAVEGSDPSRAPTYDRPQPQSQAPSGDEPPPLPPKPANCNEIKWERQPNGRWILWCDQTNWNQ